METNGNKHPPEESEPCFIVDLDGTVANIDHRVKFMKQKPKNRPAFYAGIPNDVPNWYVLMVVKSLAQSLTCIICTGRPNSKLVTKDTLGWLEKYKVPHRQLLMRGEHDNRPDHIVKFAMLGHIRERYTPVLAFEDRPSVIKMFRGNGVPCLVPDQSNWDGDEKALI